MCQCTHTHTHIGTHNNGAHVLNEHQIYECTHGLTCASIGMKHIQVLIMLKTETHMRIYAYENMDEESHIKGHTNICKGGCDF